MKLPRHVGLSLSHNEHKLNYLEVADYIEEQSHLSEWRTEESRQRAIETDSVWELQWYPDTPVGFNLICAPTLDELLDWAHEWSVMND